MLAQGDQGAPGPVVRVQRAHAVTVTRDAHSRHQPQEPFLCVVCGRIGKQETTPPGEVDVWRLAKQRDVLFVAPPSIRQPCFTQRLHPWKGLQVCVAWVP